MKKLDKIKELYEKGLSGYEIAKYTGFASSYVYRIIAMLNKAIQKGNKSNVGGVTTESFFPLKKNVHAQRVRFYVRFMGDKYRANPNSRYLEFIPDVDISCKGKVIYATCRKKFDGVDEVDAMNNSLKFWDHVIRKLEDRLNIVIGGRGKAAFDVLYEENETRDSDLAADATKRGVRWVVNHNEDGKLRLTTDWSDNELNHETHHKRDSHVDSLTIENFMNGVLNSPDAPGYDEIVRLIAAQSSINKETAIINKEGANGLNALIKLLQNSDHGSVGGSDFVVDTSDLDYFG